MHVFLHLRAGLQFDVVHFNGPQSHLLSGGNLWGPCMYALIPAVRVPPPVSVSHLVVRVLGPAEEEFQAGYLKAPSHTHLARQKAAMTAAPWSSVVSRSAATMWRLCTWAARWRVR